MNSDASISSTLDSRDNTGGLKVYSRENPNDAHMAKVLTEDEARRIASSTFPRLPAMSDEVDRQDETLDADLRSEFVLSPARELEKAVFGAAQVLARRTKSLTLDEDRRIASNIAKLPALLGK